MSIKQQNHTRKPGAGFTLIELLIVVSIIAILAAIAVPNFLEAQTRSKVAAAKSNIRTGMTALEMYRVDNNRYPSTRALFPKDPLGLLASSQLTVLSTPISYIQNSQSLRDPFGRIRITPATFRGPNQPRQNPFPEATPPNEDKSLLYFHYPTLAVKYQYPPLDTSMSSLVSIGPDLADSLGAFSPLSDQQLSELFTDVNIHPTDTIYDPTNGTVSNGDIVGFVGTIGGILGGAQ